MRTICYAAGTGSVATAAEATRATFGTLPDGRAVESVVLKNAKGVSARVIAWGAILQSLSIPDRKGVSADVTLGHDTLKGYLEQPNYFGASVGRYANRIAGGVLRSTGGLTTLPKTTARTRCTVARQVSTNGFGRFPESKAVPSRVSC
jgi:aldose 1-epimerase